MSTIHTTVKNPELVQKRREQIVLAAINLFAKKGFHKTTLRNLAEQTGLSQASIYDYVGSKEDIFFLIHELAASSAMEAMKKSLEQVADPLQKLRRMIRAEFSTMDKLADAIMLMYQEGHILTKPLLKSLLKKERAHLEVIESILDECLNKGVIRSCNVRVVANLIKSLVDAWVLKRWDLRGYASALDMEKTIIDLLFHGLTEPDSSPVHSQPEANFLYGKSAIVVNGGTALSAAIISLLLSRGVTVATHMDTVKKGREYSVICPDQLQNLKCYLATEYGPMSPELYRKIEDEIGPPDIYIHDTGIGALKMTRNDQNNSVGSFKLRENIACAQSLVESIQESMSKRSSGRIIYLTPWAWDKYVDALGYEIGTASVITLTKLCARKVARFQLNVNCIVPGFIKTVRPSPIQKDLCDQLTKAIPVERMGELSDITNAILFLVGDLSKYITGQALRCNGGFDMCVSQ